MKLKNLSDGLTKPESKELSSLEIDTRRSATRMAKNFKKIKAKRLYRGDDGTRTFEEYCQEVWNLTPQHTNRMIAFEDIKDTMKSEPIGSLLTHESQARPLAKLEPTTQKQAFTMAVESANGKQPTAAQVEQAVEDLDIPEPAPEEKTPLQFAFELHKPTRDFSAKIHALVREFEAIENASHPHISTQSIANHLKAAVAEIRLGQPYAICPNCRGKKCAGCKQSGYVNRVLYDMSPKEKQSGVETL